MAWTYRQVTTNHDDDGFNTEFYFKKIQTPVQLINIAGI